MKESSKSLLFQRDFLTSVKDIPINRLYNHSMSYPGKDNPPESCPVLPSDGDRRVAREAAILFVQDGDMTIDVRGLEPPQPLVKIVTLLENPDVTDTVIVRHDRDPLLLYPELEERGWTWEVLASPEGELHLRLSRIPGAEGQ